MQEHPIPQDITGYRFHIIGSMTLKQFGEIFLGVVIAIIFYNTNLISFIKWPFIILSLGLGALAAFVPFEERPFDHWIVTFIKTLYKPTKYFWKREAAIPDVFLFEADTNRENQEPELNLTPAKKQRIREYMGSVPEAVSDEDYTPEELRRISGILDAFGSVDVSAQTKKPTEIIEKPRLNVRVRNLREPVVDESVIIFNDEFLNTTDFSSNKLQMTLPPQAQIYEDIHQKTGFKKAVMETSQVAQKIQVPEKKIVKTTKKNEERQNQTINVMSGSDLSKKSFSQINSKKPSNDQAQTTQAAVYNQNLPFPTAPKEPNKLVGMVLSKNNDLLNSAIVEIQTQEGNTERAVKTNTLGQFFITTPLKPGEYNIVVEKENYTFQPQHIIVNNETIPPMEIRSDN